MYDNKNRYQTDVGEISKIVLSDNTVITLNTNTSIEVSYVKNERYVKLLHGEAFFEVANDPSRPFKIDTGIRMVEVIGTKFNLRKLNSELVVAVSEGLVSVQHHPDAGYKQSLDDNLSVKELMPAGSIATFSETRKIVTKTSDDKVNSLQKWRSGVLSFDDVSLEEFVSELNRYQKIKIVVADSELNKLRISGVFNSREADAALEALEEILPIRFERHADNINIVKKL
jgi:transmembrane sensor